ncbi:MAG: hypothetical protein M5U16_05220 [Hyphomicrobium sp.]|nr:hypothetical protein [Hyphomicrobium sp.]
MPRTSTPTGLFLGSHHYPIARELEAAHGIVASVAGEQGWIFAGATAADELRLAWRRALEKG